MGINVFENLDPIGCAKAIIVTGCFTRITGIIEEMDIFTLLIRTFFHKSSAKQWFYAANRAKNLHLPVMSKDPCLLFYRPWTTLFP